MYKTLLNYIMFYSTRWWSKSRSSLGKEIVDPGDSVQIKDASKLSATRVLDMSPCQEVSRGDGYSALAVHASCLLDVSSSWSQRLYL